MQNINAPIVLEALLPYIKSKVETSKRIRSIHPISSILSSISYSISEMCGVIIECEFTNSKAF